MARITLPRQVGLIEASARRARGLTQAELAELSGVSRQLVIRLEAGTATGIALDRLLRILDVAGCALEVRPLVAGEAAAGGKAAPAPAPAPEWPAEAYALDETLFDPADGGA